MPFFKKQSIEFNPGQQIRDEKRLVKFMFVVAILGIILSLVLPLIMGY